MIFEKNRKRQWHPVLRVLGVLGGLTIAANVIAFAHGIRQESAREVKEDPTEIKKKQDEEAHKHYMRFIAELKARKIARLHQIADDARKKLQDTLKIPEEQIPVLHSDWQHPDYVKVSLPDLSEILNMIPVANTCLKGTNEFTIAYLDTFNIVSCKIKGSEESFTLESLILKLKDNTTSDNGSLSCSTIFEIIEDLLIILLCTDANFRTNIREAMRNSNLLLCSHRISSGLDDCQTRFTHQSWVGYILMKNIFLVEQTMQKPSQTKCFVDQFHPLENNDQWVLLMELIDRHQKDQSFLFTIIIVQASNIQIASFTIVTVNFREWELDKQHVVGNKEVYELLKKGFLEKTKWKDHNLNFIYKKRNGNTITLQVEEKTSLTKKAVSILPKMFRFG